MRRKMLRLNSYRCFFPLKISAPRSNEILSSIHHISNSMAVRSLQLCTIVSPFARGIRLECVSFVLRRQMIPEEGGLVFWNIFREATTSPEVGYLSETRATFEKWKKTPSANASLSEKGGIITDKTRYQPTWSWYYLLIYLTCIWFNQ